MIDELYILQSFEDDKWQTVFVSSEEPYADMMFGELAEPKHKLHVRMIGVKHPNLDFLTHDARDFKVLAYSDRA